MPATNRASPAFSRPAFTACTKVGSSRSRGWLEQATPNAKYDVRPHPPRTNSEHRPAIRPLLFPVRHAHQRAPPGLRPRRDLRRARHLTPRARGGGQSVPFMGKRNSDRRSVELPVFVRTGSGCHPLSALAFLQGGRAEDRPPYPPQGGKRGPLPRQGKLPAQQHGWSCRRCHDSSECSIDRRGTPGGTSC
jgi:hypothetical protein